jgi:hypothetical protein
MSRRYVILVSAAAALCVGGWALAQPGPPRAGAETPGRFAVSPAPNGAVLVDTATGKTWLLRKPVDDRLPPAWEPAVRLDTEEDVAKRRESEARFK